MRKIALSVFLCSLLAMPAAPLLAASPMTPGLWEIKMQSDAMKNMPMRSGGMTMKVCYTKEMLSHDELPGQSSKECKPTNMRRSGNTFSGEVVCNGPNMKGTGTSRGTVSSTSFQTNTSFNGTMSGQPVNHHSQMNGSFVSADCGNVKPISMGR
jgi:hypothetical protein